MTVENMSGASPPMIGRRELVAGAGVAAVVALFAGPARGALDALPFVGNDAAAFERPTITAHLGDRFKVASGIAAGVVLNLVEVVELPGSAIADQQQQFAVRFSGASGLAQDTYEFSTQSFGRLPLFISPISEPAEDPAVYEAIVNRHIPADAPRGATP